MKNTETMYCIIGIDFSGKPYFVTSSLSYQRKTCISKFIDGSVMNWDETKKYGWGVKKVSVTIESF